MPEGLLNLQLRFDGAFQHRAFCGADVFGVYAAVASDHESDRQSENSSIKLADLRISHYHRIVDFELPVEVVNRFRTIVHGNANDLEAPVAQLALQSDEMRDLFPAGLAPGRPEIQKDYLSPIV